MKPTRLRKLNRGLWWSGASKTWHYEIKVDNHPYKGDTGHAIFKEAQVWKAAKKRTLKNLEVGIAPPPAPAPNLAKGLAEWKKAHQGVLSDRHVNNVCRAVELHAATLLDSPIDQIKVRDLEDIRAAYLRGEGRGYHGAKLHHTKGGANKMIFHVRTVLIWNGVKEVPRLKPLTTQEGQQGIVWPEQVQPFIAEAWRGGRDHKRYGVRPVPDSAVAICLMLGLGLRPDEAVKAHWEWVETRRQVYVVGKSKSGRLREPPIPDWLAEFLTNLRRQQGSPKRGLIIPAGIDRAGRQLPHAPGFTAKPVARCAQKLEIEGLTPKRLRATFATTHFEAGTKITQIAQMMGHKDPETTRRHYIVQRPKDQAQAQALVAEAMGFKGSPPTVTERKRPKPTTRTPRTKAS